MTEDAKFAAVVPGRCGWYWDAERTTVVRVTRDGSGTLWSNWGDGCGSDKLPEGPRVDPPPEGSCACVHAMRCAQRGDALAVIRDELQAAVSLLIRLSGSNVEMDKELFKRVIAAHSAAMGAL